MAKAKPASRDLSALSPEEALDSYFSTWTEAKLDSYVRNTALEWGFLPYHTRFSLLSASGYPDWTLVGKAGGRAEGRLILAENKRQGKVPTVGRTSARTGQYRRWTEGQETWLRSAYSTSAEVYLWYPSDQADIAMILAEGPTDDMACVRRMRRWVETGEWPKE